MYSLKGIQHLLKDDYNMFLHSTKFHHVTKNYWNLFRLFPTLKFLVDCSAPAAHKQVFLWPRFNKYEIVKRKLLIQLD